MLLFSVIWIVLFILSFSKQRNSTFLFHLFLTLFAVLIGFRGEEVGVDTETYIIIYDICGGGYDGYPEPLYGYANFLLYQLGAGFGLSQFILFFIAFEVYAFVIKHVSPNLILSVFMLYTMYFVFYAMNITRQMLAAPLLLLAYYYLFHHRWWRALALYIAAVLTHLSSFVAIGVVLVHKINFKSKMQLATVLGISLILGAFVLNDSMLSFLAGPYAHYVESDELRTGTRYLQSLVLTLFWSALCYIITVTSSKELRSTPYYKLYLSSVVISNLMMNLELGLRVIFCFSVIQVVFFPIYVEQCLKFKRNTAQLIIAIFYGIFFFIFLYNNSAGILPYTISF